MLDFSHKSFFFLLYASIFAILILVIKQNILLKKNVTMAKTYYFINQILNSSEKESIVRFCRFSQCRIKKRGVEQITIMFIGSNNRKMNLTCQALHNFNLDPLTSLTKLYVYCWYPNPTINTMMHNVSRDMVKLHTLCGYCTFKLSKSKENCKWCKYS